MQLYYLLVVAVSDGSRVIQCRCNIWCKLTTQLLHE